MRVWMVGGLLVAATMLAGCNDVTGPTITADDTDYALVAYGESGAALEGTLGPQGPRPFDGRTGARQLPVELQLTSEQRAAIEALRAEFRAEHQEDLDALRALFEEARAAREAGATREEVHAILVEGRPIFEALRVDVRALHEAIRALLTDAQRAWFDSHRPRLPGGLRVGRLGGGGAGGTVRP